MHTDNIDHVNSLGLDGHGTACVRNRPLYFTAMYSNSTMAPCGTVGTIFADETITTMAIDTPGGPALPPREPDPRGGGGPNRLVINWFGWGMMDMEMIDEAQHWDWIRELEDIIRPRSWRFAHLGSDIDLIIEHPFRSISRREFFAFQREFEALNERHGFRFCGALYVSRKRYSKHETDWPCETYSKGQIRIGDSIGRPMRHRMGCSPAWRGER